MNLKKPKPRVLTVIEGREENKKAVDDLKESAEKRGWDFLALKKINSDKIARLDIDDIPLDYVVFRDLSENNYYESERLLKYLNDHEKVAININPKGARSATSDKHYQQGLFISHPPIKDAALPTFETKHKANVMSYIKGKRVAFPIILKDRFGTAGKNITLIRNESDLDKITSFDGLLIEQYIEADQDWRVFVMGGTAVGIMKKVGDPDHPENFELWSAGKTKSTEEDQKTIEILSRLACEAAAVSHLEYTGVDIIQDKYTKKFYILETNFAAGWLNRFIITTGINIPDLIIDWLEERGDAKNQSIKKSVERYIKNRKQYLSKSIQETYDKILAGEKGITKKCAKYFKHERAKYLYDTGLIFKKLASAYEDLTESKKPKNHQALIKEIEQMPLSWAGNFIGPETGTLETGAILSALYLFILGKTKKV